jgi:hypothetical protein
MTTAAVVGSDATQVGPVKTAFSAAITASRAADAPSGQSYSTAAATAMAAGQPAPMATDAQRDDQLRAGLASLAQHFTPAQADHEAIGLRNAVAFEADPKVRNVGTGVSDVKYLSVSIQSDTATLEAHVTTWAKTQLLQPDGKWLSANPVNVVDYRATLVRGSSGQWQVSDLHGDFVPGQGP